jgi:AbrB family looped-hinge helix DNA binding protein
MTTTAISSKGWIVIPSEIRRKYHLEAGTRVAIVDYGGVLAIVPVMTAPVEESAGMLKQGPPLTRALLKEHADEQARER